MPDIWEEGDSLIVNFGSSNKKSQRTKERMSQSEYDNVDLASGYPRDMIWTTQDGKRIAIPNMTDSHLLNTIAWVRNNIQKPIMKYLADLILSNDHNKMVWMIFDMDPRMEEKYEQIINSNNEFIRKEKDKIDKMSEDEKCRMFCPQFKYMLREAYKRKILIEAEKNDG